MTAMKVHAIYNAQHFEIPVEPPATVAEVAEEIGRHWSLLAWTFAVEYLHGKLWVGPPARTTIGHLLKRQGPLRMTSATGRLLGTAPRNALELRVRSFRPPEAEVSVVGLARKRARQAAEAAAVFTRHAIEIRVDGKVVPAQVRRFDCEVRWPGTCGDLGDSDCCEPPGC